jgi:hypothetical protein
VALPAVPPQDAAQEPPAQGHRRHVFLRKNERERPRLNTPGPGRENWSSRVGVRRGSIRSSVTGTRVALSCPAR